jgi:uncharacterized protein
MDAQESVLDPVEVRVLGSLVEKQLTTPDYYPLSLNALTIACNQVSNRDPVMELDEPTVMRALDSLRDRKLAYLYDGAQSRVKRYGHRLAESHGLAPPEVAALCVLMLRGPQTVGEIRGRTGRMHDFPTLADAEAALDSLAAKSPRPLAARLPRQPGMKEQRCVHLLGGEAAPAAPGAAPSGPPADERIARLEEETAALRRELAELRGAFDAFRKSLE